MIKALGRRWPQDSQFYVSRAWEIFWLKFFSLKAQNCPTNLVSLDSYKNILFLRQNIFDLILESPMNSFKLYSYLDKTMSKDLPLIIAINLGRRISAK